MIWHVYKSISVGHAKVQGNRIDHRRFAEDLVRTLSIEHSPEELDGVFVAVQDARGTRRFRIKREPDGLHLENAR